MAALDSVTHDRIYRAIKADILNGSIAPGARLIGPTLAREYEASLTPVREALYRLVGEGLITMRASGFYAVVTDDQTLVDLLEVSQKLLALGLKRMPDQPFEDVRLVAVNTDRADPAEAVALLEAVLDHLLHATRNDVMIAWGKAASERVRTIRLAQCRSSRRARLECRSMVQLVVEGDRTRLARQVRSHHQRLIRMLACQIAARAAIKT